MAKSQKVGAVGSESAGLGASHGGWLWELAVRAGLGNLRVQQLGLNLCKDSVSRYNASRIVYYRGAQISLSLIRYDAMLSSPGQISHDGLFTGVEFART